MHVSQPKDRAETRKSEGAASLFENEKRPIKEPQRGDRGKEKKKKCSGEIKKSAKYYLTEKIVRGRNGLA